MNGSPAYLYWYHKHPSGGTYRSSSANCTGPYIGWMDVTGETGVFGVVKYVPEAQLLAEREKLAALRDALRPFIGFSGHFEVSHRQAGGSAALHAKYGMTERQFATACQALHQLIGDQP